MPRSRGRSPPGRPHWIKPMRGESWRERLTSLAKRYLTTAHRDDLSTSCGFATLSSDAAHASERVPGLLRA